jgi:crossover junction endodeoxyribonuclease RuvC
MALDGPYTVEDLLRMTGHRSKKDFALPVQPESKKRATPKTQRIIGVDPGTRVVGYGIIEHNPLNNTLKWIEHGTLEPQLSLPIHQRLQFIFEGLEEILQRTKPDVAALEETFAGINMKSAIAMGEGRGVALLALARARLDIAEISIKKAVTGSGASGKEHVAAMVCATLNLKVIPKPEDTTDALACAIALARRL